MKTKDQLPVDEKVEIKQDEIDGRAELDGQQDDLNITSVNENKAIHGQEYSGYDDLNWSSGGDDSSSVLF